MLRMTRLTFVAVGCAVIAWSTLGLHAEEATKNILQDKPVAGVRIVTQGGGKLVVLGSDLKPHWEMPWGGIHDIQVVDNKTLIVQQGPSAVAEIDVATKKVIWTYNSAEANGNKGKPVEVHAFQRLANGNTMIAESGVGRIIEVDADGKLVSEIKLKLNHPHPHTDTRLARKLENGNYLVAHEGDGFVREYDSKSGEIVWEYEVPMFGKEKKDGHGAEAFGNKCFAAVRLANGNTLLSSGNGHSVLEVTPAKEIVWKLEQNDLPGITLAWVTTVEVLANGNYMIGNCHAGPDQPILLEIEPKTKAVAWKLDGFKMLGNDVSNSQVLDQEPLARR